MEHQMRNDDQECKNIVSDFVYIPANKLTLPQNGGQNTLHSR